MGSFMNYLLSLKLCSVLARLVCPVFFMQPLHSGLEGVLAGEQVQCCGKWYGVGFDDDDGGWVIIVG